MFSYNLLCRNTLSYLNSFLYISKHFALNNSVQSRFIYECGTCTLNNVEEMINFMTTMYNLNKNKISYDDAPDFIKQKYNRDTFGKFKILKMPKDLTCDHHPSHERQFLINHNFQINGYNVYQNQPLKLHKCKRNELESIYRQIQSGIFYDSKVMRQFIKFSQRIIDKMVDDFYANHPNAREITLEEYYSKIGGRRKEYEQGYQKYFDGGKLEFIYRMHNKDDEKQYIDWNTFKSKSRNICAQQPMGKILLGIPCELAMDILHAQPWCGPGSNYGKRCSKFKEWISNIFNCGVICCDGSSFDSTQHQIMIKNIDSYFLKRVLEYNEYLNEWFDLDDVMEYIKQDQFTIFSKYGYLYRILGTQLSGRMNTCLCNTLRSGLYIMFILDKMGILGCDCLVQFEVNGDDQIIFINNDLMQLYIKIGYKYVYANQESNQYHGLGQICKIFDCYPEITGAEYLSTYLIYDRLTNDIWMVRKPERFLQMIPFTFRLGTRNKRKLDEMRVKMGVEIVEGQLNELKGIEFYEILLNKYMENYKKYLVKYQNKTFLNFKNRTALAKKINDIRRENFIKNKSGMTFTPRFNELFYKFLEDKFGINNDDILEYKEKVNSCDNIDGDIQVSLIDKFYPSIASVQDFELKCKNFFHNKSYIYINNDFSKFISDDDFLFNY